jgi:hypothetical protein
MDPVTKRNRLSPLLLGLLLSTAGTAAAQFPPSITVPVVTDADGAAGERFRTSFAVTNRGQRSIFFYIFPRPEGVSTCDREPGFPSGQELTAGATQTFEAGTFLEWLGSSGTGFLEIVPADPSRLGELAVTTRIRAETAEGTFGQEIPSFRSDAPSPPAGVGVHLIGLQKGEDGTRTNLGIFVLPASCNVHPGDSVRVDVRAFWPTGGQAAPVRSWQAPVAGLLRISDVFAELGLSPFCTDCRISVHSSAPLFAWASVVEGGTSDPTLVTGRQP